MKSTSVSIAKSSKSFSHANTMRPPTAKSYAKKSILENEKSKESFGGVRATSKSQKVKKQKRRQLKNNKVKLYHTHQKKLTQFKIQRKFQ